MKHTRNAGNRLKAWEVALMLALAVFFAGGARALQTQEALAEKVVRLHVLANSDSAEDQTLKLQVRDAVLARAEEVLGETENRSDAEMVLREHLPELEHLAEQTVLANGYAYGVTAELAPTEFPTREYESFSLPAGEYLALRILIGEGAGQNWWCVVFPPLCTAASADVAALSAGLSEEEVSLITEEEGYVLKFKTLEWWQQLRRKFS